MLVIFSPAGFEGFFEELGGPAQARTLPPPGGPPDMEQVLRLARKHNMQYLMGPQEPRAGREEG